ncbi:MAG: pyridoxal-phosphate dependent enzyme [Pseudoflavonifractor sp.]|nr:pyridoxal-phosphate dependent enzyme [Alloprevotella sp.]MCM1117304.1 pyridoxal-phosphate dependent enzyme [Pseudoflavonifractor sp.]
MIYYSTANPRRRAGLLETISRGLPPDGGYFMPERIPVIPRAFFNNMADMSLKDIGYVVANTLFGDDVASADLKAIVTDAINFDTPLCPDPSIPGLYALELTHGPSHSYKDFGARFMAHLLRHLHRPDKELTIILATSGDTGEAVARSFFGMPSTKVYILYPRGATGRAQLAAFASLGGNIIPIEVRGSFEECHDMVSSIFADSEVTSRLNLFAANSFSPVRLLPQTIYFFYAYARLMQSDADLSRLVIAVPAGNLGNLTAGLIAKRMGLPVDHFIATDAPGHPCILHEYFATRQVSTAIGHRGVPPNFWRLSALYGDDPIALAADVDAVTVATPTSGFPIGLSLEPAMARQALAMLPPGKATTRIFLDTTSAVKTRPGSMPHSMPRPAITLPPSPQIFREYILSSHKL